MDRKEFVARNLLTNLKNWDCWDWKGFTLTEEEGEVVAYVLREFFKIPHQDATETTTKYI